MARREEGGWAELQDELLAKVLEELEWVAWQIASRRGWSGCKASAAVRLVCSGWKAVHDALVMKLVLRQKATDEGVGMLVRRFPAVVSIELKGSYFSTAALTDEALRAVSSLPALTFLNFSNCDNVTGEGLRAVIK
jgi:hypothetical protein